MSGWMNGHGEDNTNVAYISTYTKNYRMTFFTYQEIEEHVFTLGDPEDNVQVAARKMEK